jgi:hypothetical protein
MPFFNRYLEVKLPFFVPEKNSVFCSGKKIHDARMDRLGNMKK